MSRELKQNLYEHGGSRIYFDDESGERDLIADTYGEEQRSLAIFHFIKSLYEPITPHDDANAEIAAIEAARPVVSDGSRQKIINALYRMGGIFDKKQAELIADTTLAALQESDSDKVKQN